MKKSLLLTGFCLFVVNASVFAAASTQTMPAPSGMNSAACSALTPAEQQFASQITDMNNQMMFCSKMTAQQRSQAMQMMGKPDSTGRPMSADQALVQYMQQNNLQPNAAMPPAQQGRKPASGGGCPVN